MVIDPDGETFWYIGEFTGNQPVADPEREVYWSTWVSSFKWTGCSDPLAVEMAPAQTEAPRFETTAWVLIATLSLIALTSGFVQKRKV